VRGIFVTGTDTNVGKTVACAALLHRYGRAVALRYWKPIQTGTEIDNDTREVMRLAPAYAGRPFEIGIRLAAPVSPHLAAALEGVRIDLGAVIAPAQNQPSTDRWIVEGAGGVLVPINERDFMIDLMSALALAVVVVARSSLGTINHTLLTLEALRARSLQIAGVLMVGPQQMENRRAIERYGDVRVIGELPRVDPLDADTINQTARTLDPSDALMEHLR
jgi:malonyl-CoA O-methyltransferase